LCGPVKSTLGADFMPKPWQPLNLLVAAKQALACL
jgi:hypothetical protein